VDRGIDPRDPPPNTTHLSKRQNGVIAVLARDILVGQTCAIHVIGAGTCAFFGAQPPLTDARCTTRGTQDVNDPSQAHLLRSGARHGVVHVLGSASALFGNPVTGGTERRPRLSRDGFV